MSLRLSDGSVAYGTSEERMNVGKRRCQLPACTIHLSSRFLSQSFILRPLESHASYSRSYRRLSGSSLVPRVLPLLIPCIHSLHLSLHQVLQLQPCNTLNLLSFSSLWSVTSGPWNLRSRLLVTVSAAHVPFHPVTTVLSPLTSSVSFHSPTARSGE